MAKQTDMVKEHGYGMQRPMPKDEKDTKPDVNQRNPEEAENDPKLVTTIEDRLANLRDMTRPDRRTPAAEPDDDEEPTLDSPEDRDARDGDDPDDGQADDSDGDGSPTLDNDADDEGEWKLPEAYERAAIGWGWKQDEVRDFFEQDPERAMRTFQNLYESRNKASAEFAAIGRNAIQQRQQQQKTDSKPRFEPVDTAKLREQYGEDAGPLIETIEAQNKMLQQIAESMPANEPETKPEPSHFESKAEENNIEQQIWNWFESDGMKPYEKVYGKLGFGETWEDLSPSQRQHRMKVLEKADQIAGGAHLQGRELPLDEALEAAHLLVTQKYRDDVLIDGMKAKVVKRGKGVTLKPSKGKRRPGAERVEKREPGTRTREQLATDVQSKMDKLFGGQR